MTEAQEVRREVTCSVNFAFLGRCMQLRFATGMLGLSLAACATSPGPIGEAPGIQVYEGNLPPPTPSDLSAAGPTYPVGPFDELKIDVFGVDELSNRVVSVDATGKIAYPLIGELGVSGMTTAQIADEIRTRLQGQFVRNPQVTVELGKSEGRTVTVYGEVTQPGLYPARGASSLLKTIASARGLAKYAKADDVVVFRTVNGQEMATLYNLKAISRGNYNDPAIYPNDVVVVGESSARRMFDTIVGAATLIATPLTILLQRRN